MELELARSIGDFYKFIRFTPEKRQDELLNKYVDEGPNTQESFLNRNRQSNLNSLRLELSEIEHKSKDTAMYAYIYTYVATTLAVLTLSGADIILKQPGLTEGIKQFAVNFVTGIIFVSMPAAIMVRDFVKEKLFNIKANKLVAQK